MDNAAIRAFVGNGGLGCLPRADLPTRYRQAGPIHGPYHDWLIGYYMDRDHEQWAWDGLVALLSDLQRCEPVLLINWACRTLRTRHTRPTASKADGYIERDARIRALYQFLLSQGDLCKTARGRIAKATGRSDSAVRKVTATIA